jgi:PKD repeat protein
MTIRCTRIPRVPLGVLLAGGALLAAAGPAAALPPGGGGGIGNPPPPPPPLTHPPVPQFSMSPNPAVVNSIVIGPIGPLQPVKALQLGTLVKFDASASTDDRGIASYAWDLDGNGSYETTGAGPKTERRYSAPGNKLVKLRVTDTDGVSRTTTRVLILHRAPSARLAATPATALLGQSIALSAAGSSDDNGIAKYEFDLDGDGTFETPTGTTQTASTSLTTLGTRTLNVKVTDVYGASSTASARVVVHRAPTAAFTFTPAAPVTGTAVQFDGSGSGDDDPIADYSWDLDGDGTFETDTLTSPKASKVYATPGTVQVRLRVTDDHGVQDVVTHPVTIEQAPPTAGPRTVIDATAPKLRISKRSVHMSRSGKVKLRVACPKSESACTGRLTLRTKRGSAVSRSFALKGGTSERVTLRLGQAGKRAVKRHGMLRATALTVATDAAGNVGSSQAKVTIRR